MILQQVGNVQYIGWRMEFSCREDFVNDLQHQAKKMEDELEEWNRKVADTRKKYYELNYYTTRQLLVLRSELGQLKSSRTRYKLPQQGQVITLLSSISMEITPEVVERVVCDVSSQLMQVKETAKNKATETKCREPVLGEVATLTSSLYAQSQDRATSAASVQSLSLSLNEIQTKSFTNLTQKYGIDEKEALEAIQRFPNYDDIETWLKTEYYAQSTDDIEENNIDDEDIQSESDESEDELLKIDQECSQGRFFILRLKTHQSYQYSFQMCLPLELLLPLQILKAEQR